MHPDPVPIRPKGGRPRLAGPWLPRIREMLGAEPTLTTAELFRRARQAGYPGGKSAFYALVTALRGVQDTSPISGDNRGGGL